MTSLAAQEADLETEEQVGISLAEYKRNTRRDAVKALLWGSGLLLLHVVLVVSGLIRFSDMFRSLLFVIGGVGLVAGLWEYYQAGRLTLEDLRKNDEAQAFAKAIERRKVFYTTPVVACLGVVTFVQLITGDKESIQAAGLVKSAVGQGEAWRLFTCATLHVNIMHIWMNGQALVGLGKMIEALTNRAYLTIVFLPSAVCGSIFSLLLMPHATSVGASGGIMGLVGFLAVLGYRRKEHLPSGFFKSIMMNICFMGVIGLVGFAIIDNAAHLGGLVGGVICGLILIKKGGGANSTQVSRLVRWLGWASLFAIVGISLFSIVKILK